MVMEQGENSAPPTSRRVTRCDLLWAALFLIGVSALGWFAVARLLL